MSKADLISLIEKNIISPKKSQKKKMKSSKEKQTWGTVGMGGNTWEEIQMTNKDVENIQPYF